MPVGEAASQEIWWGSGQALPLFPCSSTSPRDGSGSQGAALGSQLQIPLPPQGPPAPHRPHLMRIPVGRASSSLAFLRFCSASSEDLQQSRVRGTATAPQHCLPHSHPTHGRKSFTSSTVMSPVVSSGFSMLLLGESMGLGEKAAGCSSGDPGESRDRRDWGQPGHRARLAAGLWDTVCVCAGTGWSLTVTVRGGVLALRAAWDMGAIRLWQLRCHR